MKRANWPIRFADGVGRHQGGGSGQAVAEGRDDHQFAEPPQWEADPSVLA
ncbi:MAG: hypothetical protein R8G34_13885 [Paracoccaceae bacterium]|nr:hypothetical protein [Paracoccaceae bacterium]